MDDLDILDITNNYYKSFFDKSCRSLAELQSEVLVCKIKFLGVDLG